MLSFVVAITVQLLKPAGWGAAAADLLQRTLTGKPEAVVSFPTGHTPLPFYAELRRRAATGALDVSRLRTVMLDDYLGARNQEENFYHWLRRELFDPLQIGADRLLRIPTQPDEAAAGAADPMALTCARYERQLAEWGGCDLQFLGLGGNGHVGFNDPGSAEDSRTRVVQLAPETARANAEYWKDGFLPSRAVTMGMATILSAKYVCLLVRGADKAGILREALAGPISSDVPASFLRRREQLLVLADEEAGAEIPATLRGTPDPRA